MRIDKFVSKRMEIKQLITVQAIEFHLWSETKMEPDRHLRLGKIIQFRFSFFFGL